ncbi:MAG: RDD family protein [Candidatus Binatia bacterium]
MTEERQTESAGEEPTLFPQGAEATGVLQDRGLDRLYERPAKEEERASGIRWGGLSRRTYAFLIDLLVLLLFFSLLSYLAYVGYRVGLSAHDQSLTGDNLKFFLKLLLLAGIALSVGYFVLFHGMEGQTVGKWFLGLRVVGANQGPISYSQSLIRCFGYLLSGLSGVGFLWILFSREKRGWHDLLARTWVIREGRQQAEGSRQQV